MRNAFYFATVYGTTSVLFFFFEFDLVISFSRCFATFPFPVSTCVTASVIVVYVQKHIERPDADVVPSPSDILSPNGAL